jgi:surface protein
MSSLFFGCKSLISLDLEHFDTRNVIINNKTFEDCRQLRQLKLKNFITSKVTQLRRLFYGCEKLTSINLSGFDTSEVSQMISLFTGCKELKSLDLSSFNTLKLRNMDSMFGNLSSITTLNLSNFKTPDLRIMKCAFSGCTNLVNLDISNLDTSKVTSMEEVFKNCISLKSINLSHFDTSKTTKMREMFYNCSSLVFLDLSNFNTIIIENMKYMFKNCKKLKYINMKKFEQSQSLTGCSDIFLNTPENMIFCIDETKNSKIFNEIKKKTNYTINCSDDLIYLFLKEAFVDIGIITNSISNSILLTTIPETASETIKISTNYISYIPTLIPTLIPTFIPTFIPTLETKTTYLKQTNPISTSIIQSINIENLNDNEEIYNLIIDNILQMFSRENSLNRIIPGKDFIFFELTDSKNQLNLLKNKSYNNNNLSIIDLGQCEDVLREKYHIDEKDPLIILKQENISNTKSSDKNFQYEVFEPYNKTKLNLSVCKGITVNIHSKIELSENTIENFYLRI